MTLRALIFDVDGTIADTEDTHRLAFNAAFAEQQLPFAWDHAEYRRLLRVPGGKERLAHYFRGLALGARETERLIGLVPALHQAKTARFEEDVASGAVPFLPGVARLVRAAWEAGLQVGIASTTSPANVNALVARGLGADARARFAVIACGDMVEAKKPAPDIYRLALATLGLRHDEAVAFEDSGPGLAAAHAAGLCTVVTPTRWSEGDALDSADLLLPHLGDADHPLDGEAAIRAGGPSLTLERLAALLDRSAREAARRSI